MDGSRTQVIQAIHPGSLLVLESKTTGRSWRQLPRCLTALLEHLRPWKRRILLMNDTLFVLGWNRNVPVSLLREIVLSCSFIW